MPDAHVVMVVPDATPLPVMTVPKGSGVVGAPADSVSVKPVVKPPVTAMGGPVLA